jgi:putative membrane protein insertion efficiency factor
MRGPSGFDHLFDGAARAPALAARGAIRVYRYTLSGLMGRQCRYLPTCSEYTEEAIARHGLWAGGWMGLARICRCNPLGPSGLDVVPQTVPAGARWFRPWAYGKWRGTNAPPDEPIV